MFGLVMLWSDGWKSNNSHQMFQPPPWRVPLRAFLPLAWVEWVDETKRRFAHDSPMESHGESRIPRETHGKPMRNKTYMFQLYNETHGKPKWIGNREGTQLEIKYLMSKNMDVLNVNKQTSGECSSNKWVPKDRTNRARLNEHGGISGTNNVDNWARSWI